MMRFQVICIDWTPPDNVVDEFDSKEVAQDFAERMDGLALRCIVVEKKDD
jgi:hypothetical protein